MSAAKARPSVKTAARGGAKSPSRTAAKGAAKSAARTAAKGAAKGAARAASSRAVATGGQRIGRGTRWTEDQVSLLLTTVKGSPTAKEAFETVARQLGKSTGTVQQKYYNLQKQAGGGGGARRRGRPRGSTSAASSRGAATSSRGNGNGLPSAADLRSLTVDELVGLASRVRGEVDRRRQELDAASKLLKG